MIIVVIMHVVIMHIIIGFVDDPLTLRRYRSSPDPSLKRTLPGAPADVSEFACVAADGQGPIRIPVRECKHDSSFRIHPKLIHKAGQSTAG
jgi:hypothetical protein